MKLDGKLKGGLAWAGLVVILAVPAADIVMGPRDGARSVSALPAEGKPAAAPAIPAAADPVETASTALDPVKSYLDKNKKLPDYISGGTPDSAAVAAKPAGKPDLTLPQGGTATTPATETAAVTETPPVPLPRSARPKPAPELEVASLPAVPAAPASNSASEAAPLVLTQKEEARAKAGPSFPLSDGGDGSTVVRNDADAPVVGGDQLEEWDSGSLAQYLERKGLIDQSSPSVSSDNQAQAEDDYDPDGFFLDQGPNRPERRRRDEFWFF